MVNQFIFAFVFAYVASGQDLKVLNDLFLHVPLLSSIFIGARREMTSTQETRIISLSKMFERIEV